MAGGNEMALNQMVTKFMNLWQRATLATDPAARAALFEEARLLALEIEFMVQANPNLLPVVQRAQALLQQARSLPPLVAASGMIATGYGYISEVIALNVRQAQTIWRAKNAIQASTNLRYFYSALLACRAAGNFAAANVLRAQIINGLSAIGITVSAEAAAPVIIVGALFLLLGDAAAASPMKNKVDTLQELQVEYEKYNLQIDAMELRVGGLHLGPNMPRLSLQDFAARRYPSFPYDSKKIILVDLKWGAARTPANGTITIKFR